MVVIRSRAGEGVGKNRPGTQNTGVEEAGVILRGARGDAVMGAFPSPLHGITGLNGDKKRRKDRLPGWADFDVDGRGQRGLAERETGYGQSGDNEDAWFWSRRFYHDGWVCGA